MDTTREENKISAGGIRFIICIFNSRRCIDYLLFVVVGSVAVNEHGEVCSVHHRGGDLLLSHLLVIFKAPSHHVITKYLTNH